MDARLISFGLIEIGGRRFEHDVVVEVGAVRRRRKGASKAYRDRYGHTPPSPDEAIPWSARRLIIGTGVSGQLRIMPELYEGARLRGVEIVAESTEVTCRATGTCRSTRHRAERGTERVRCAALVSGISYFSK